MTVELTVGILALVRSALGYAAAKNGGDRALALQMLTDQNLEQFGLVGDVLQAVRLGRASLTYLAQRGVVVDEVVKLLETAQAEGRDVTSEEVQTQLNITQTELDETQAAINAMSSQ